MINSSCYLEPPKGMVLNESFGHQYSILLRKYGIAFSQVVIVKNFGKYYQVPQQVTNPL